MGEDAITLVLDTSATDALISDLRTDVDANTLEISNIDLTPYQLALSGGTGPLPFFPILADNTIRALQGDGDISLTASGGLLVLSASALREDVGANSDEVAAQGVYLDTVAGRVTANEQGLAMKQDVIGLGNPEQVHHKLLQGGSLLSLVAGENIVLEQVGDTHLQFSAAVAQGAQGETGAQGAQGTQGAEGAQGATGVQGVQGVQGETGAGAQGVQGETGAQGATGATGGQGETGAQGAQGETGAQGVQGAQGSTGGLGPQGAEGSQGESGSQGVQGTQGVQGFAGTAGEEGDAGAAGAQGIQGATGAQGAQGAQGDNFNPTSLALSGTLQVGGAASIDGTLRTTLLRASTADGLGVLTSGGLLGFSVENDSHCKAYRDLDVTGHARASSFQSGGFRMHSTDANTFRVQRNDGTADWETMAQFRWDGAGTIGLNVDRIRANGANQVTVEDDLHCTGALTCDTWRPRVNPGLTVAGDLFVDGHVHYNSITAPLSPFWVAGNINATGQVEAQKGRNTMTATKLTGDSAFDVSFPAHPEGDRYTMSITSTEFHILFRMETSTGFRLYCRNSTNSGNGFEGTGLVSIMILA